MIRAHLRSELLFCCASALALLVGCGGEDGGSGGGGTDASSSGNGGSGGAVGGGGSGGDAGGNGGAGGAEPILETVRAVDHEGQPLSGVDVVVSAADGSVLGHHETGDDGTVLVDVPPDGSVTVLSQYDLIDDGTIISNRLIQTGYGIANGGSYEVIARNGPSQPVGPAMQLTVQRGQLPSCPPNSGEQSLLAAAFCSGLGSFSEPNHTFFFSGCPGESSYDLFLYAKDDSGVTIGYGQLLDQPFTPSASATQVLCPLSTDLTAVDVVTTDIPVGALNVKAQLRGSRAGHQGQATLDSMTFLAPVDIASQFPLRFGPAATFSNIGVIVTVWPEQPGVFTTAISHQWSALASAAAELQWSAGALATVDDLAAPSVAEPGRPLFSWTLSNQGALGDAVGGRLSWTTVDEVYVDWTFTGPPERDGAVHFPELPEELAHYALVAGDSLSQEYFAHYDWPQESGPAMMLAGDEAVWNDYTKIWALRGL